MKRQRARTERINYGEFFDDTSKESESSGVPLNRFGAAPRRDLMIAQIQEGDTLQAICLRYNCSLSELKRLNKIEKEIEIHARSTIRIPVTAQTLLLDTLPGVHSSGNSSPKHGATAPQAINELDSNPKLQEKLFIAALNSGSGSSSSPDAAIGPATINEIILNTKLTPSVPEYRDSANTSVNVQLADAHVPLLSGVTHSIMDDSLPQPRVIPVRHRFDFSFNGADCDMSWVCLFICILLLCVAIPLIYVFWTVEDLSHHHHPHSLSSEHNLSVDHKILWSTHSSSGG